MVISNPQNDTNKETQVKETTENQVDVSPVTNTSSSENQEIIELDNLEDIEFLLDEIEDQIAPLAL